MKLVLVTVTLEPNVDPESGVRLFRYPASYDWREIELAARGQRVYQGTMTARRMAESEELLLCLRDDVADKLTTDGSGLSREVTAAEADAWLATALASAPDEVVKDETRLSLIQAKIAAGVPLTQDDVDVLDVNNPKTIISRVPKTVEGIFRLSALEPAEAVEKAGATANLTAKG